METLRLHCETASLACDGDRYDLALRIFRHYNAIDAPSTTSGDGDIGLCMTSVPACVTSANGDPSIGDLSNLDTADMDWLLGGDSSAPVASMAIGSGSHLWLPQMVGTTSR